jgi:hypothetical protein
MRFSNTYRILLYLYPAEFRRRFSAEMLFVFKQRENEHLAERGPAPLAFLLTEFSGIMKGAYIMWFAKILGVHRKSLSQEATTSNFEPLTVAEATKQRDAAIKNMVASIAKHDFSSARQYSYEETRLKNLIRDLANQGRPSTSPVTVGPGLGKTALND